MLESGLGRANKSEAIHKSTLNKSSLPAGPPFCSSASTSTQHNCFPFISFLAFLSPSYKKKKTKNMTMLSNSLVLPTNPLQIQLSSGNFPISFVHSIFNFLPLICTTIFMLFLYMEYDSCIIIILCLTHRILF